MTLKKTGGNIKTPKPKNKKNSRPAVPKPSDIQLMDSKTRTELKREQTKKRVLVALANCNGIWLQASKSAKVSRNTIKDFFDTDPEFRAQVLAMDDHALDTVEQALFKNINAGKEASIIFYLKTKGKRRGYIEKNIISVETGDIKKLPEEDLDAIIEQLQAKTTNAQS